jgi:hypothetical protein
MADKQKGLQRPQAPVDLFTLQPEEELVPEVTKEEVEANTTEEEPPERFKTSVEITPEALELIDKLKMQYRRENNKHLPLWRILDEAVKLYASRELQNT